MRRERKCALEGKKTVRGQKVISRKRKRIDMGVGVCIQGLCEEGYRKWTLKEKCKYGDGKEGKTKMKPRKDRGKIKCN